MITPCGRFRWARLPFGLSVSSEIFQKRLTEALGGLKGVICVADDIIVIGRGDTQAEAEKDHSETSVASRTEARKRTSSWMTLKQPSIKTRSPSWPQDFSRRSPTGSVEGCSNPRHASTNWCPRCSKNLWHGSIPGQIYAKLRQWSGTNQGIDKEGERVGLVPRVWWGTECCEEESHQHSCAGVLWPRERTSAASRQQQRRSWGSNSSGWQANWVCIEGAHPSGAEMGTNWEGDTVTSRRRFCFEARRVA